MKIHVILGLRMKINLSVGVRVERYMPLHRKVKIHVPLRLIVTIYITLYLRVKIYVLFLSRDLFFTLNYMLSCIIKKAQRLSHPKQTLFVPCREELYKKSSTRRVVQEGLYQKIFTRRIVREELCKITCQAILIPFDVWREICVT
jgi:hypothetical protein